MRPKRKKSERNRFALIGISQQGQPFDHFKFVNAYTCQIPDFFFPDSRRSRNVSDGFIDITLLIGMQLFYRLAKGRRLENLHAGRYPNL